MMDRQYVIENGIVDRYLRGELTSEESIEFEEFYLNDPETLDELEIAEALRSGSRVDPVGEQIDEPAEDNVVPIAAPKPATPRWIPAALAAAVVFGFGLSVVIAPGPAPIGNVRTLDLGATRGAADQTLRIGSHETMVLLRVAVGMSNEALTLTVTSPSGDEVLRVSGLKTDDYGDVTIAVPTSSLPRGLGELRVSGSDSDLLTLQVDFVTD